MFSRRLEPPGSHESISAIIAFPYRRSYPILMKRKTEAVYENGTLKLAEPLPLAEQARVYVTVEDFPKVEDDPSEYSWLHGAASNAAFDFLKDPAEDIYGPADGKPFRDAE